MPACVNENSTVLAFDADHLSRDDMLDDHNDQTELWEMLDNFKIDRVARNVQYVYSYLIVTLMLIYLRLVSVHGMSGSIKLDPFLHSVGISYPKFSPSDFKYSASRCAPQ